MAGINMVDYGTTIKNLRESIDWIEKIESHQFSGWKNVTNAMEDAIEKLEEYYSRLETDQATPIHTITDKYLCGDCYEELFIGDVIRDNYCPNCGMKVKWE